MYLIIAESDFQMLTKGQVMVVNSGQLIHLDCEFLASNFNLFDNPTWWRKAQRYEETQVNMMGNIMEPFESTRRFRVSFHSQQSTYKLTLSISGITFIVTVYSY